jgi:hypothetical protein
MACNYQSIRHDNERRYGTDIGRIGPMLLADRYDDRTHFIFELLQNAEDALARRPGWQGSRAVSFNLTEDALRVSHYGKPFDEADVRGVCGIAESTKDLTAIGRFGIGFKSVYAYTDRPQIHSGPEDFAVDNFVLPIAAPPVNRHTDETVILIPLKTPDENGLGEIADGLQQLGAAALLFLRQIEEINWSVEGNRSGLYLRESKEINAGVRRVIVIGQERGKAEIDEAWLLFSRPVTADDGRHAGHVEIAFSLTQDEQSRRESIRRVERSPLVVFFPTVVETHLGFLVQGPYRTTPSRDNVPRNDPWNQRLVGETASLLVEALRWQCDHDLLDAAALRCLPLDPTKFGEARMFAPLFAATKQALSSEPMLPRFDAGLVPATRARLSRTQELRDLFTPTQLAALFERGEELAWLSSDITQDRTPELRRYLMQELGIMEVTPETVVPKLDKPFLQAQPDSWIQDLYQFLNGQPALRRRFEELPLVRLEDGSHVPPRAGGQAQAFLPGKITTGFPTVRASVCVTKTARDFLQSLGLTEPDPVDDVVRNVLPKYHAEEVDVSDTDYESDIRRILTAFATDSKGQREKLLAALRETAFVMAVDMGDGSKYVSKPGGVYLATERLKELFAGVADVLLVDDEYSCLRGEDVRELLEACGAVRYLRPIQDHSLSQQERRKLRERAGHAETSGYNDRVSDWTFSGLGELLKIMPRIGIEQRRTKAKLLWEELAYLEERRGKGVFTGEYTWTHYGSYRRTFDAAFVRKLNETAWVPDANGDLQRPELILFDTLGLKVHPFLQSKIRFKPAVIEVLAKEVGIEPGVLDLLKKIGVTSEAELRDRLGLKDEPALAGGESPGNMADARNKSLHGTPASTPTVLASSGSGLSASGVYGTGTGAGGGSGVSTTEQAEASSGGQVTEEGSNARDDAGKHSPAGDSGRVFISYVAAHPDEEVTNSDGLEHSARMALETQAIDLILSQEPEWQRTPTNNPGFDLFQTSEDGTPTRWCEVKAMTGGLRDRPVGLSHTQFECAREHGEAYWLYVVEHSGTDSARIVRIQDPAGKTRTFTFDHGWLSIAHIDAEP